MPGMNPKYGEVGCSFLLEKKTYLKLQEIARKEGRSLTKQITWIIQQYIKSVSSPEQ